MMLRLTTIIDADKVAPPEGNAQSRQQPDMVSRARKRFVRLGVGLGRDLGISPTGTRDAQPIKAAPEPPQRRIPCRRPKLLASLLFPLPTPSSAGHLKTRLIGP